MEGYMSIKMVQMRRYKELTMRYIDVDSYGGIYEHKDGTDGKVQRINNEIHRRGELWRDT
jgi:uncharacterized protein YkvS